MTSFRFAFGIGVLSLSLPTACSDASGEASSVATSSGSTSSSAGGAGGSAGAGGEPTAAGGGGSGGAIDKAANCTGRFGSALTDSYGRIDGTVLAVVKPTDTECPMPNSDHVILEVVMNGAAYRMVVNVRSEFGDPDVLFSVLSAPLPSPAWADGWHTDAALDYVGTLGVHTSAFVPHPMDELSDMIADAIDLDAPISVYTTSSGGASAHLIHKNAGMNVDGAIVVDPTGASPQWLLFQFGDQSF